MNTKQMHISKGLLLLLPLQFNPIRRVIAVLKMPKPILKFIEKAEHIVDSMTNNNYFITPSPPLLTITTQVNIVRARQAEALKRTMGAVEARNAEMFVLAEMLRDEVSYVQQIADDDVPNSEAIVLSAGLSVKKITIPNRPAFSVKNDPISGTVILRAKGAGLRTSHDWEMGDNVGPFMPLPSTIKVTTKVVGLEPGSKVYFRHRVVNSAGEGPWDQIISIIVT
jgi:hypothetical protein